LTLIQYNATVGRRGLRRLLV